MIARAIITAFVGILVGYVTALADPDRRLSVTVYDVLTGDPVEQAEIAIPELAIVAHSNQSGEFEIRGLPLGRWTATISRAGYVSRSHLPIEIIEESNCVIFVGLDPLPVVLPGQELTSEAKRGNDPRHVDIPGTTSGSNSVADILARIPGVRVYGSVDTPGGVRVSVGGEPPYRVSVLLDGLPLAGGVDGSVDLSTIPTAMLTAIEVKPGSQTALAGDAAVGGSVNLITAGGGDRSRLAAGLVSGSWNQYRHEISGSVDHSDFRVNGGLERFGRGQRFSYPVDGGDSTRLNSAIDGWRGHLQSDGLLRMRVTGFGSTAENGSPGPIERPTISGYACLKTGRVQVSRDLARSSPQLVRASGWYEFVSEYYNTTGERLVAYQYDTYMREQFAGVRAVFEASALGGSGHVEGTSQYRMQFGADYRRSQLSFGAHDRVEHAVRAHWTRLAKLPIGSVQMVSALALDLGRDDHPAWSPRIEMAWQVVQGVKAKGGWGESFRRAPLTSMFWKEDSRVVGNPSLRPERASEWDLGFRLNHSPLVLDTRYFERNVSDMIAWDLRGPNPKYQPVNLDKTRVIGREDYIQLATPGQEVSLGYTHVFNDGTDQSPDYEGRTLIFMPRHTHDLSLTLSRGRIWTRTSARWVSERYTLRANTKSQGPYRTWNSELTMNIKRRDPNTMLGVRMENLTNEAIELLKGYPSPGRSVAVSINLFL